MINKFRFEQYLSNTPTSFQRFILNRYLMFNKNKQIDKIKYSETISAFEEKKCIFIHIPKTVGISLSKTIFGDQIDTNHLSLRRYRLLFSDNDFHDYYKFTFIRNPWDKLFSCYRFLKKGGSTPYHLNWKNNVLDKYEDFNDFVKGWINNKNIYSFSHFLPQYWFISLNTIKGDIDFIGRFENLNKDFLTIKEKLKINRELMHLNKSDSIKKKYTDFYNQESIDIVSKAYKKDIDLFNYDFK